MLAWDGARFLSCILIGSCYFIFGRSLELCTRMPEPDRLPDLSSQCGGLPSACRVSAGRVSFSSCCGREHRPCHLTRSRESGVFRTDCLNIWVSEMGLHLRALPLSPPWRIGHPCVVLWRPRSGSTRLIRNVPPSSSGPAVAAQEQPRKGAI
jgi:hypothetical protein